MKEKSNANSSSSANQSGQEEESIKRAMLATSKAHEPVFRQMMALYCDLFNHDGFGEIKIEMRILRRGQKEVILHCGKEYRYVLDCDQALASESFIKHLLKRDILAWVCRFFLPWL